jgi:hypothetical protein
MPTTQAVSNIAKIGRATVMDDDKNGFQQIVYYQAGIGAETDRFPIQSKLETIGGVGLYENVREAYGFLANNCQFFVFHASYLQSLERYSSRVSKTNLQFGEMPIFRSILKPNLPLTY